MNSKSTQKSLLAILVLGAVGLVISIYALYHHMVVLEKGSTDFTCNINELFNCDRVALSQYSQVLGLPLGLLGCAFFAALMVLSWIARTADQKDYENSKQLLNVFALVGLVTSAALGYLSFAKIGSVCVVCVSVYAVTLAIAFAMFWVHEFSLRGLIPRFPRFTSRSTLLPLATLGGILFLGLFLPDPDLEPLHVHNHAASVIAPQNIPIVTSRYAPEGEDYRKGADDAGIQLVVFSDFQCPACARTHRKLQELEKRFGNKLLIVFKNYPLDQGCNPAITRKMHERACFMAKLGRCAGRYGKFWDLHDAFYELQPDLSTPAKVIKVAKKFLSNEQITHCQADKSLQEKIAADIKLGNDVSITGTPTIFVNGHRVRDLSLASLTKEVEARL